MKGEVFATVFATAAGWMGIAASPVGLTRIILPQTSEEEALRRLGPERASGDARFTGLADRFRIYFRGKRVEFPDRLDLSGYTEFQRAVWEATRRIPRGETRSYTWVAAQAGNPRAVRAAGGALGNNPLPVIIPCHRVLAADGSPGGFSGGLDMKRRLLALEAGS